MHISCIYIHVLIKININKEIVSCVRRKKYNLKYVSCTICHYVYTGDKN